MKRKDVVAALSRIASLMELNEENPFKIRAFQNASRAVKGLEQDLGELIEQNKLQSTKGIGKGTAAVITELMQDGRSSVLEELRSAYPAGVLEMLDVPKLGPKKVRLIYEQLGIQSVGELEYACNENRLIELSGFGEKTQRQVLDGIAFYKKQRELSLYSDAIEPALAELDRLRKLPGVERAELAGGVRRSLEVVPEIVLVAAGDAGTVLSAFQESGSILEVVELGESELRVRLDSGPACRLILCDGEEFGVVWQQATGSETHNEELRERAAERGLELSAAGLWRDGEPVVCAEEEGLYELLGLPWIPPPLREGWGEIEAAEKGELPHLIEDADIRGILHNHTTWSDGAASLETMVRQARKRGHEYILISDHSKSAFYAGGLSEERLEQQSAEIDEVQSRYPEIRILKGSEVDILTDGSMDYADEVLARFDLVVGSVHSGFHQSKEDMTKRLVRAIENPHVHVIGHLSGRLLLARKPYLFDMSTVLEAAARTGTAIEINANPNRLDLDWRVVRRARKMGVKFCINPDAHHIDGLDHVRFGVGIARKGWLEAGDVWNTRPVDELLTGLRPSYPARGSAQ